MLKLENINVWYGSNHILKDLNCTVHLHDFIVIVGANGAGKSTFFDLIAGNVKPTSGTITLDGQDITHTSELERAGLITRLFQNTRLNSVGSMTVAQNLAMAHYSRRRAGFKDGMHVMPHAQATALVEKIGMPESILNKTMQQLSGGQRQLIAFVMATQLIPQILLLDEPTAALDPQASTKLLSFASHFIKTHGITSLLITHDPYIALNMGNKIWVLENGTISKQFTADEKKNLNPDKLIGHIDYAMLAR